MCGRYVAEDDESIDKGTLYRELRMNYPGVKLKSGEIFPTETVPLLCGNERVPVPGMWGFPKFDGKGVIINARSESVAEKFTFRDSFLNRRCIVPSPGYYERSKQKEKFRFNLPNQQMLYMAGIYQSTPDGLRFVILTTAANDSVSPIHHRMPLILTDGMTDAWMASVREAGDCLRARMPKLYYSN